MLMMTTMAVQRPTGTEVCKHIGIFQFSCVGNDSGRGSSGGSVYIYEWCVQNSLYLDLSGHINDDRFEFNQVSFDMNLALSNSQTVECLLGSMGVFSFTLGAFAWLSWVSKMPFCVDVNVTETKINYKHCNSESKTLLWFT